MDPLTIIVTAVVTGAAVALKDTADAAIRDAYYGLKSLIVRRFGDRPAVAVAVDEAEKEPAAWKPALEAALKEARAYEDAELVALAQALLGKIDPDGTAVGKYKVQIGEGRGVLIGDHGRQEYYEGVEGKPRKRGS